MSTENTKKNNLTVIGALVLLFGVFWIFCRIELFGANPIPFIIDCVFFIFIYALCLFEIPLIIPLLCLVLGCVGRGYLYMTASGATQEDFLIELTYFFALVFFIEQLYYVRGKGETVFVMILSYTLRFIQLVCVGGLIYIFDDRIKFYYFFIFNMFMAVAVSIIYLVIAFVKTDEKKSKSKKKKQKEPENDYKQMRISFGFSVIPVAASCLFLVLNRANSQNIISVLPMLWLVNIDLLYIKGHPLVCSFVKKVGDKTASFLNK